MEDFLRWYLNPLSRISRGTFNGIIFLAFIPVIYLQIVGIGDKVKDIANVASSSEAQNILSSVQGLQNMASNGGHYDAHDPYGELERADNMRQTTREWSSALDLPTQSVQKPVKESNSAPLSKILSFLILIALLPIVKMRMRDLGVYGPIEIWVYTALVYTAVIFDGLKLLSFEAPTVLNIVAQTLSFILLMWLSMSAGKSG